MKHTTIEKAWWSSVGMGVLAIALLASSLDAYGQTTKDNRKVATSEAAAVRYSSIKVDGLNIAYREAGNPNNPKIVLLHGFPAASHQYRDLLIRPLNSAYWLPLCIQASAGVRGNPAKTTLILSFPEGSKNPSMLRYALFSVLLSNCEHGRAEKSKDPTSEGRSQENKLRSIIC